MRDEIADRLRQAGLRITHQRQVLLATPTDRDHLVSNIVGHMSDGVERTVQERAVALWRQVDAELGQRIAQGLGLAAHVAALASSRA